MMAGSRTVEPNDRPNHEQGARKDPREAPARSRRAEHRKWRRSQILDVAEPLFAARGLHGTSIREITNALGCNSAMVYYYYEDKTALYEAVVRRFLRRRRERREESIRTFLSNSSGGRSIEALLEHYVSRVLEPGDNEDRALLVRLLSRELLEPQVPPAVLLEELVQPVQTVLTEALLGLCPDLGSADAHRAIHSVVAQVMHAIYLHRLLEAAGSAQAAEFDWNETVDHVVRFSAAGIRALVSGGDPTLRALEPPEFA